ncbi:RagB/SusD family nutrient uptake outer membrane protein [Draconibacterium sediminis]|uniref:RagB/SusD family nutrient uptake outer membrane protein n=1 Tax=Draconibacterium sediminis TaxID=1544798 RepID=UPI000ADD649E|nr:RagB/SusD family nutrient uptake outer membrane protein [Draconibacterium sediminis]
MKKINIISIVTLIMVLMWTSCSEDFLEPKPLSFYAPENTFVNEDGLNAALVACLRNARHEFYGDGNPMITENIFSDVAVEGTTDKSGPAMDLPAQILPDANLNSTNYNRIGWYWQEGFYRIKYANTVISRIDVAEWDSEADRNNILGKAYFHRARVYYRLTQQFGDVPLLLEEVTAPKLDFYTCTRESILKKMKKDMEFAAQWVKTEADGVPIGDINKAACNHLLTKINLALHEYDDAIASASAVIDDGYHHLMTERFGIDKDDPEKNVTWDLHQVPNKSIAENRERIYLLTSREELTEDGASERISMMRQNVPFWPKNIKTPNGNNGMSDKPLGSKVSGKEVEIDMVTTYGRGIGRCRQTPYSHTGNWDDPNDYRHAPGNWMNMEDMVYNNPDLKNKNDDYYGKNLQLYNDAGGILCTDTIRSWFGWPHYKLYVADPTDNTPDGGNGDWYCYRLAETYLLRAEAYFWNGESQKAADDLNAVRTRANAAPYSADQINLGTILDERARELYYEEPRKTEITRMAFMLAESGKPCYNGKTYSMSNFSENNFWYDRVMEKNSFYRENVVAPHYTYRAAPWIALWPIPASAINSNTMGVINQNKGYPGEENYREPVYWQDGEGEGIIVDPNATE